MKKTLKYFSIISGILVVFWIVGRLTNMFQWYSAPTYSNYPTLKPGDRFFASNLIEPERFDLVCYYATTPEFGKQIWVHRLCGLGGDKVEIRGGDLYVNDKYVDNEFSVAHNYILSLSEWDKVKSIEKLDDSYVQRHSTDSVVVYLSDKSVATHSIKGKKQILPKEYNDEYIGNLFSKKWNQDNFGPVVVPRDKFFVLGDNRLNSQDSRYIGFIEKTVYVATVIGQ